MMLRPLFEKMWTRNYRFVFLAIWTFLVAASVIWNLYRNHAETVERARIEARTIFEHNLAYRRWNAKHGGVYVKIDAQDQPNPFIVSPERDLTATDGTRLTLINPFWMTRQAYSLLSKQSPMASINRTISLKPLNPIDAPDAWETKALNEFEKGRTEFSEITEINGLPYMRVLRPYITEKACLKCHGRQGYKVGDVRGAISIAVPMIPYYTEARKTAGIVVLTHLLLWLIGAGTIILFSRGLQRYQGAIEENERKFRIVSEFAYDFDFWVKESGEFVFMSPSCERITGYARSEFMEKPDLLNTIIHPDDRDTYKNHIPDFKAPFCSEMEFRIVARDGRERWLSHCCGPIYVDGKLLGRRASNRDVTEKKKLEDKLLHSRKMESLGHFAGGVAHDFNNVLTAIGGFTHLLGEGLGDGDEDSAECLEQISYAVKFGKNLTSNLLTFGRKQIINPTNVHLSRIIGNVSDILKALITEEIDLRIDLTEIEVPIFADPYQIGQLIINLCTNAKDAMPEGGKLVIRTDLLLLDREYAGRYATITPGTYMVLAVHDTGTGIDNETIEHVYEPFFTTKQSGKGTGLGLTIVYSIVRQHNGFIDIESKVKRGTNFKIFLPASGELDQETSVTQERRPGPATYGRGSLLVAEDDELVRKFLYRLLVRRGYTVFLARDGEEAISLYRDNRSSIDLLILDVILPRKNGREVYSYIRTDRPDMRALFISGHTDDIITAAGIFDEDLQFLSKPLEAETFLTTVAENLRVVNAECQNGPQ